MNSARLWWRIERTGHNHTRSTVNVTITWQRTRIYQVLAVRNKRRNSATSLNTNRTKPTFGLLVQNDDRNSGSAGMIAGVMAIPWFATYHDGIIYHSPYCFKYRFLACWYYSCVVYVFFFLYGTCFVLNGTTLVSLFWDHGLDFGETSITLLGLQSRCWGQTFQILNSLSPTQDCTSKRVK